jgi:hypothetical protein
MIAKIDKLTGALRWEPLDKKSEDVKKIQKTI